MPTTIVNVSNRLPVTVGEQIKKSSGGLVTALEGLTGERFKLRWVGWPGGEISDPDRRNEVEQLLDREFNAAAVFLEPGEVEAFYEGFSNSSVWPLLHYMPSHMHYESGWWEAYERVNRRFADKALDAAGPGDLVWVHDYQLMLVPAMIKRANPDLRVGFFLHTPFPSYEIFRIHPRRTELIAGLIDADQIGFHTFNYLRHFRNTVLRLLGAESEINRIRHEGHAAHLGVYPIGINGPKFQKELDSPEHEQQVAEFAKTHEGKRVVLSVERLDYTKGVPRRLEAIDAFLAGLKDEQERDRVKFIFISVPSREGVDDYRALREEIEGQVGRINGKYATLHNSPIRFVHGSVNFGELCALYAIADVALVTPLIDGMNLVAKEFVACQRDGRGVLVLSEFAGAAEELFNAILVNPYDSGAVARALGEALATSPTERAARMGPMRERVMSYDASRWAQAFVDDLASRDVRAGAAQQSVEEPLRRIKDAVAKGRRVALFLDYDGTLRELERSPDAAAPTAELRATLDALKHASNVVTTVISGRSTADLEKWLGEYPFALVAEHGASLRRGRGSAWEQLDENVSYDWKEQLLKPLSLYRDSTPGSSIEVKRTSIVWHYRRADPEFGAWRANELAAELQAMLTAEPVEIRLGKKIVEVTAVQVNKGAAVARLLESDAEAVVVVAGDDQTDESMFRLTAPNFISIKVGPGDTAAQYRLPDPKTLRRFLLKAVGRAATTP